MAGSSVTQTYTQVYSSEGPTNMSTLTLSWVSDDATGAVSATTTTAITDQIAGKYIVLVVTDPGATAPTDDYDITITDANGVDVMGGALANRDTANTEQALPLMGTFGGPRPIATALTLNVTNAGNSKIGSVIIYLSR
ncbi:MAG: hypothetical protein ABFD75_12260 [Smithella sp.]